MEFGAYPLLFRPVYKAFIWGGTRLAALYGRQLPGSTCAESWEIADRPDGMSIVRNGPLRETALGELVRRAPGAVVGRGWRGGPGARFPLLVKIIDAGQRLSVQVHPDERGAGLCGGEPKTEAWYVLDAQEGACVYAGLRPGTTRAELEALLARGEPERALVRVPAIRGSVIYVPGGLVHAICEGCLLLEIQQNSNTTYRVHDWGRTGSDGKPRPLHVDQAMRVIRWDAVSETQPPALLRSIDGNRLSRLLRCPYFDLLKLELAKADTLQKSDCTFHICFTLDGELILEAAGVGVHLRSGETCLVPAAIREYRLAPAGPAQVLIVTRPGADYKS